MEEITVNEPCKAGNMETSILEWSCQIRDVLKGAAPMPLANVARRITNATTNEVAMALGWLAHEGKVQFRRQNGRWEISLQESRGVSERAE